MGEKRTRAPKAALAMMVLVLAVMGVGCPCVKGAINNSPEIRWWLFSNFGASRVCPEMQKRGVPLKLATVSPNAFGRFFPRDCQVRVDDANKTMIVRASGTGYAVPAMIRRVGVYAGIEVEYRPDFRMEEDALYVWGRFSRMVSAPDLRVIGVENPAVNMATRTPLGDVATLIGQGILASEIVRGFTVVRQDDGDDVALGILNPPEKPPRPLKAGKDRVVLGADTSEIRPASREYLGPFEVSGSGMALFVHVRLGGAPLVYGVVDRATGELWRQPYEGGQALGPPPRAPLASGTLGVGDGEVAVPLPEGSYYVVLENRAAAPMAPLGLQIPIGEAVAVASYSVEVGDKP